MWSKNLNPGLTFPSVNERTALVFSLPMRFPVGWLKFHLATHQSVVFPKAPRTLVLSYSLEPVTVGTKQGSQDSLCRGVLMADSV